jgi:hypothetical protein
LLHGGTEAEESGPNILQHAKRTRSKKMTGARIAMSAPVHPVRLSPKQTCTGDQE